jgi:hypothetical protein
MKTFINLLILLAITASAQFSAKQTRAFDVQVYGEGPSMFLIPGATSSGNVWDATVAKYKDKYQIHVFTLAGYAGIEPLETEEILQFKIIAYALTYGWIFGISTFSWKRKIKKNKLEIEPIIEQLEGIQKSLSSE